MSSQVVEESPDPVVVVSSDTHIGPFLEEDLRPYCPQKYRPDFDDYVREFEAYTEAQRRLYPEMYEDDGTGKLVRRARNRRTEGHHDVHARLRDMNFDGVASEVIFHGSQNDEPVPFTTLGDPNSPFLFKNLPPENPELAAVGRHIFNAWLADQCSVEPQRHVGLAQIPIWDVEASVKEIEWAARAGLRGVNFPTAQPWLPEFNKPVWEPFWAVSADHNMPLTTHIGAGADADYSGPVGRVVALFELVTMWGMRAVPWMVLGGAFERHPNLKLVITEVPGMWWPQYMTQLDSTYRATINAPTGKNEGLAAFCKKLPSEYLKDSLFVGSSFMCHTEAQAAVRDGYYANCMWGSDYPHTEGTFQYPDSWDETPVTHIAQRFAYWDTPEEPLRAMLGATAARVYGLDLGELTGIAAGIDSPTMKELREPVFEAPPGVNSFAFRKNGWWD
jgi:predicted TIM-barrel fold metal-dependent hydrolase